MKIIKVFFKSYRIYKIKEVKGVRAWVKTLQKRSK